MNPHSTKDRIQNHLAYKLGLCMIAFNKIVGGGGKISKILES
ncbi:sugar transferase [Helicobacter ganmani]|nr:sugar transferase [uncultured Helicobacter sp.]